MSMLAASLLLAPGVLKAQLQAEGGLTLIDSLNHNTLYLGDMTNAWQYSHQFQHTYDHQMALRGAFQGSTDSTFYLPVANTHLEQVNTGISGGAWAGSVEGANLMNMSSSQVAGMFTLNANLAAMGTNQITLNAVAAFTAPAP
jgi:hypothetical protein